MSFRGLIYEFVLSRHPMLTPTKRNDVRVAPSPAASRARLSPREVKPRGRSVCENLGFSRRAEGSVPRGAGERGRRGRATGPRGAGPCEGVVSRRRKL